MLPPILIALLNRERGLLASLSTFITFFTLGGEAWLVIKHTGIQLRTRDGFAIIVLLWLLFSFIGAVPTWMDDDLDLPLADALFEGVSGITITGATVISDVSALPESYLCYQAWLNSIGGLGVIVLTVAVLSLLGIGDMKPYQSETPDPFRGERLAPKLADTARTLQMTYVILGLICTPAYWAAGMSSFDTLCYGLSTISLGGFSTCSESIGFYNSHAVEPIAGILSLLSAFNFTL